MPHEGHMISLPLDKDFKTHQEDVAQRASIPQMYSATKLWVVCSNICLSKKGGPDLCRHLISCAYWYLCANPVIILQLQAEWRPRLSPGRRYNRNSVAGHHYCPVKLPKRTPPRIRGKHNKWEWECTQKSFRTQIRLLGFLYLFKETLIMIFSISHYVYKCLWNSLFV